MMNLDIKKHIKFTVFRLCFNSNFNHVFRSIDPETTLQLAQRFNQERAVLLSKLIGCRTSQIKDHAYLSTRLGGLGWTKAKILTTCGFIGGCRNALYEMSVRFTMWQQIISDSISPTIVALKREIANICDDIWSNCFPKSMGGEVLEKTIYSLVYTIRSLQKHLTKNLEMLVFHKLYSSAVENDFNISKLMLEKGLCNGSYSDSSLFISVVPRRYGLCLRDQAFVLKMKLFLGIPIDQILEAEKCVCNENVPLTLHHAINCHRLITYRTCLHNAVRDTVAQMARVTHISCITEPLLKETMSSDKFTENHRGDIYCDWINGEELVLDFVSCDINNFTSRKLLPEDALYKKERKKHNKYDSIIEHSNLTRSKRLVFMAFAFSINGRLSPEALLFMKKFQQMVNDKTLKRFDRFIWRARIQFAVIHRLPMYFQLIRRALVRESFHDIKQV
ncbi:hypothetical protein RCL1_003388 [Eukaryota sp. TZLM3-RCL]